MKLLIWSLLLIAQILYVSFAEAKTQTNEASACSEVDVRRNMNPELKQFFMTPSSQGNIGWCYGYAATDLLSQSVGVPLSPVYTSAYYASQLDGVSKFFRNIFQGSAAETEGGFIGSAIGEMVSLGKACTVKGINGSGWVFDRERGVYAGTKDLSENFEKLRQGTCYGTCDNTLDALIEHFLGNLQPAAVKKYVIDTKNSALEDVIFNLVDAGCGNTNKISIRKNITYSRAEPQSTRIHGRERQIEDDLRDKSSLIYKLDRALEKGKVVGLEYKSKVVTGVGGFFDQGGHASSIVGRKVIDNKCHYLVRNSWGDSCHYKDDVICDKSTGSFWVTRDIMKKMALGIIWIN